MKSLQELINKRKTEKIPSERGELLKFFRDRLRDKKGKQYSYSYLGMKTAHLEIPDLYYLRSICIDSENRGVPFGKVFWGSLKPKP